MTFRIMKLSWKTIGKILISALLFLFFLSWIDVAKTFQTIPYINWNWFVIGLIVLVVSQLSRSLRFALIVRFFKIPLNLVDNFLIHNIVTVFGLMTPAKLGEGGKLYYYKNADKRILGFSFLIEKFFDFIILSFLSLFILISLENGIISLIILAIIIIIAILGGAFVGPLLSFLFPRKFEKEWLSELKSQLTLKNSLILFFYSLFVWIIVFMMQYFFALAVNLTPSFLLFCQIMAASTLIGFLSGLPGGIGSRELTLTFLFTTLLSAPKAVVGAFAILNLFGQYTLFAILAFVSYPLLRKRQRE